MNKFKFVGKIEKGISWHDEDYRKIRDIISNNKGNLFIKRYVTGEIIDISDVEINYAYDIMTYSDEVIYTTFTTTSIIWNEVTQHPLTSRQLIRKTSVHLGDEFYKKTKRITLKDMIGE